MRVLGGPGIDGAVRAYLKNAALLDAAGDPETTATVVGLDAYEALCAAAAAS